MVAGSPCHHRLRRSGLRPPRTSNSCYLAALHGGKFEISASTLPVISPTDQKKVANDSPEIRLSASKDLGKLAAYVPFATALRLEVDLSGHDCTLIDLAERRILRPVLRGEGKGVLVGLPLINSDYLFLASKR